MEATFFTANRRDATGVMSADDLGDEIAGEALRIPSPGALFALIDCLNQRAALEPTGRLSQLKDATCQSFPVWEFDPSLVAYLAQLEEPEIDPLAQKWRDHPDCSDLDADLYELATFLAELQETLRASGDDTPQLFVLLEEKAL